MSNEYIWAGDFGNEYNKRNDSPFANRQPFWMSVYERHPFRSVLEIGCNKGHNLEQIAGTTSDYADVWGLDVNVAAIQKGRSLYPYLNLVTTSGLDLPFRDDYFDMVFTAGVLIHQSPSTFEQMMQEVIRVSCKYIMAIEYDAEVFTEVPYRGLEGALFKGPFGEVYERKYGLLLLEKYRVGKELGFDDTTVWILQK